VQRRNIRECLTAISLLTLAGCDSDAVGPLPPSELRAAPLSVTLAGKVLVLEAYAWRNFEPVIPEGGPPLDAALRITTADASPVPTTIRADAAWLLFGDEVWATEVAEQHNRFPGAAYFEVVARNGPHWPTGASVDVVVRVSEVGGRRYLLRAPGSVINRVE
jgi:hypothetical protein